MKVLKFMIYCFKKLLAVFIVTCTIIFLFRDLIEDDNAQKTNGKLI